MFKFLKIIVAFFDQFKIPYMLSASVAMSIYTVPRSTRDLDFVAFIKMDDVDRIVDFFKDNYYCDKDAIIDAIKRRSIFNIIDYNSGFKAYFVILKDTPFRVNEFNRREQHVFEGYKVDVVTKEDLLLSKIIWIQEFESNIQKEDIATLWRLNTLDKNYVIHWVNELNLNTFDLLK
jgi:hypothetical protein